MLGLAAVLLRRGAQVSGTDRSTSPAILNLRERGVQVCFEQTAESVPAETDLLVASAAIAADHPEVREAQRRGLPVMKYAQLLGALMAERRGIAISGTHGKSTTTAWLAYTVRRAGLDPSFVIGADVEQLGGGSGVGDGPHFIAEACEYDRSFLNLAPTAAAILNIEEDHLDYYRHLDEIRDAFCDFARLLPHDGRLLINGQDERSREVAERIGRTAETFGLDPADTWCAAALELEGGRYSYDLTHRGRSLGRVRLGLSGRHNVYNSLAVAGLAHWCGATFEQIRDGLAEFGGARRRLELRGVERGVAVADDYAHHPTEIRATLRAARERFTPKRLWCVFQPHQHSRTRFLLADFAASFTQADRVVVPQIYFVRDSERDREAVSGADLALRIRENGGLAVHIPEFADILQYLVQEAAPGDLVLTMGAGDIWKVADELLARLRNDLPA